MVVKELRQKSKEKLQEHLRAARTELHNLEFSNASGQLKRVREIRRVRRLIAQISTILSAQNHDKH